MYSIKQASARTGIPIPLLRAWEARYRIVEPRRTAARYRLYDDEAIDRLRSMRALVDAGWTPSSAAGAILAGDAPRLAPVTDGVTSPDGNSADGEGTESRIEAFVAAAVALDSVRLERVLDDMFGRGSFERVASDEVLPALTAVGDAWAEGRLGVGAEHAASHAVLRRLAGSFQAAGRPSSSSGPILVGLPPGSRHELGALVFAVAARRAGLPVLYLGPDLPAADWVATAADTRARAAVIGSPTLADREPAAAVAQALRIADPGLRIAFGGRAREGAAERLAAQDPAQGSPAIVLPDGLVDSVDLLDRLLADVATA